MSRINSMLRASLESATHAEPVDAMASLEAYVDYRAALEEYEEADVVQSQLSDMSEGLIEVEGLIDESRTNHELSEDQVEMQVAAVNAIREVIDGDVTEISMESFATIESASLEASDQSDGLLKRMWEGFLAMLKKIKEAFKKMWAWIFGGKKRAEDAAKVVGETAKGEDSKDDPATETAERTEAKESVAKASDSVAAVVAVTKESTAEVEKAVTETVAAVDVVVKNIEVASASGEVPSGKEDLDLIEHDYKFTPIEGLLMSTSMNEAEAYTALSKSGQNDIRKDHVFDIKRVLQRLESDLKQYANDSGKLASILESIDKAVGRLEDVAGRMTGGRTYSGKEIKNPDIKHYVNGQMVNLRKLVNKLQNIRGTVVKLMQKGDSATGQAAASAKKLSRTQRKAEEAKRARGL